MFCPKCGAEIREKMKFCFNCGENLVFEAVEEKEQEVNAENGYNNETNDTRKEEMESTSGEESNVEAKRMVTDEYRTEPYVDKEDSFRNQQSTSNLTVTDKMKNKCKEVWNKSSLFSKVLTISVAISALLGLVALLCGKTWSVVIAVLQIALFVVGWLMKKEKIKQNKKWLPYLSIALATLLLVPFFLTFSNSGNTNKSNKPTLSGEYKIGIEIDCAANLIFSKYDLKVFVDNIEIGALKHGEKDTFNINLGKGTHTLEIQSADSSSVKGNADFKVNQNSSYKYNVSCKNDKVNIEEVVIIKPPVDVSELGVKSYDDVKKLFTDAGFINVTTKEIKDLTADKKDKANKASDISIDGKSDFTKDTTYSKDVAVVITYHTFSQEKALEATFPVENAKRAAVVAITNGIATDVFAKDGNTYDASKFHSFADTSGNFYNYYMKVNSLGTWTVKNEKSWHVVSLELEHALGNVYKLDLDVNFDGTNYSVSNIKGTYGRSENIQDISGTLSESDKSLFLKIPANLIKENRTNTRLDTHKDWVASQISSWDFSNRDLNALIKKNLNDEKSFKHIETTYVEIVNEKMRDMTNEMIKSSNSTARVEIGDIWFTTKFSAKNAFNGTVKNTAVGFASFKEDTVILVAIE